MEVRSLRQLYKTKRVNYREKIEYKFPVDVNYLHSIVPMTAAVLREKIKDMLCIINSEISPQTTTVKNNAVFIHTLYRITAYILEYSH
jgi:hypothetical protein